MHKFLIGIILLTGLVACSQSGDESVTIVKHGQETEYLIHLKKVKDSLTLNLSDFSKNHIPPIF